MDKWKLFEMLKNNNANIGKIEQMSAEDVKEALIEYLIYKRNNGEY